MRDDTVSDDTVSDSGSSPEVPDHARPEVIDGLTRRTQRILDAPARDAGPEAAAFEKSVVGECRYLLRLLAMRRRATGELRAKLREREVEPAVAREALARTDRAGLLDDAAFARDWVSQRRELRGLSDEALRRELRRKDVSEEHILTALALDEDDEEHRARQLVQARLVRDGRLLQEDTDGSARGRVARRLDALLRRKGYDGALALRVISAELRAVTGR